MSETELTCPGALSRVILAVSVGAVCLLSSHSAKATAAAPPTPSNTIAWRGLQWNVKSGAGKNPGQNSWSAANVSVDTDGDLHLAITSVAGTWYCAEVWTDAVFPFGTFQWQVATRVDNLDPNVVLGLFAYGPPSLGPDGTHEIDIEYARFGAPTGDNGRWTIFPNAIVTPPALGRTSFSVLLDRDARTTSRFTWGATNVGFQALAGFQAIGSNATVMSSWFYDPADPAASISQAPMPVHMNLWLFGGSPPANGQGVEVVIHDFSFSPAAGAPAVPALGGRPPYALIACLFAAGLFGLAVRRRATR